MDKMAILLDKLVLPLENLTWRVEKSNFPLSHEIRNHFHLSLSPNQPPGQKLGPLCYDRRRIARRATHSLSAERPSERLRIRLAARADS